MKVISGGQTGADRAALVVAKRLGLETGGWMPRGFLALDGCHPEFEELYGMQQHLLVAYEPRTYANVKDSDATLRIASNFVSRGELCTLNAVRRYRKPWTDVQVMKLEDGRMRFFPLPETIAVWFKHGNFQILNVAGNSEKNSPGIFDGGCSFLEKLFQVILGREVFL